MSLNRPEYIGIAEGLVMIICFLGPSALLIWLAMQ
jgi:hypothetical protein